MQGEERESIPPLLPIRLWETMPVPEKIIAVRSSDASCDAGGPKGRRCRKGGPESNRPLLTRRSIPTNPVWSERVLVCGAEDGGGNSRHPPRGEGYGARLPRY